MTNHPKSSTMQDGEVQTGAVLDAMWEALKAECCKNPAEAKTIVFCGEGKFRKSMAPFATAATAAPVEQKINEATMQWALRELADGWIQNNEREGPHGFYQNARRVLNAMVNWTR